MHISLLINSDSPAKYTHIDLLNQIKSLPKSSVFPRCIFVDDTLKTARRLMCMWVKVAVNAVVFKAGFAEGQDTHRARRPTVRDHAD